MTPSAAENYWLQRIDQEEREALARARKRDVGDVTVRFLVPTLALALMFMALLFVWGNIARKLDEDRPPLPAFPFEHCCLR